MNINAASSAKQAGLKPVFTAYSICRVPARFPAKLQAEPVLEKNLPLFNSEPKRLPWQHEGPASAKQCIWF